MATVSVVLPVYDGGPYLKECIESVLAQTFDDWELLVVDDGSTDDSVEQAMVYVNAWGTKVRLLFHPGRQNRGVSASRNLGIERASGKYIAFLDADDVWLPRKLERQLAALEQHPHVSMSYAKAVCIDENGKALAGPTGPLRFNGAVGAGIPGRPIDAYGGFLDLDYLAPTSTVIAPCPLLIDIGGFSVGLKSQCEDIVMWAKLARRGPVLFVPETLALYRVHGTNWSSMQTRATMLDVTFEFLKRLVAESQQMDEPLAEAVVQYIHRYWNEKELPFRIRLQRVREVVRCIRANGTLSRILPRYLVRRTKKSIWELLRR